MFLTAGSLMLAPSGAQAADCGHVVYHYRVAGVRFNALLNGLDYQSGIDASGIGCGTARGLVLDYARVGFRSATSRNDFRPPRSLRGFRCSRIRDGDDSGRDFCRRRGAHFFFSDSDGQFA